ncbi:hypothetical protein V5O48_019212 [Marasmius crinis-equi]|uniref:Uncharacterized protein n=1 Tax=Marasmius crinis-equi TaxID=585013 RepID=A0ABR3EIZ8_9AGAR
MSLGRRSQSKEKVQCPRCKKLYTAGGPFAGHWKRCLKDQRIEEENFGLSLHQFSGSGPVESPEAQEPMHSPIRYPDSIDELPPDYRDDDDYDNDGYMDTDVPDPTDRTPSVDDILSDFHPASLRPREHKSFDEFGSSDAEYPKPYDKVPWRPFPSRFDFEVADLALRSYMNREHTQTFLRLLEEAQ